MNEYIPQIHILYAYPFDSIQREFFESREVEYPSVEEVNLETRRIQDLWAKVNENDRAIKALIDIMGVNPGYDYEFYVYASGRFGSMSVPLLLCLQGKDGKKMKDGQILEVIIHELVHRFAGSPRKELRYTTKDYWKYIRDEYKELSPKIQNHLLVYAVLEKIHPIVLDSEQLEMVQKWYERIITPGYREAIDIVKKEGADKFIKEFTDLVVTYKND